MSTVAEQGMTVGTLRADILMNNQEAKRERKEREGGGAGNGASL